jgi:hypothetical protein
MLNFLTEIVNAGVSHVGFTDLFKVSKARFPIFARTVEEAI